MCATTTKPAELNHKTNHKTVAGQHETVLHTFEPFEAIYYGKEDRPAGAARWYG